MPQCNLADKDNDTVANIYTGERDELMIGTKEERLNALGKLYPTWDQNTLWTMFEKCCNRNPDMDFIVMTLKIMVRIVKLIIYMCSLLNNLLLLNLKKN